jgi:phage gpG-like protein
VAVTFRKGEKLERIERKLLSPTTALRQIGVMMVAESQRAFKDQKFGDRQWDERAPINVFGIISDFAQGKSEPPQRRFEKRPAMRDTGRLAASIAWALSGTDAVEVGTTLAYAGPLHRGGKVESEKITEDLQRAMWKWLRKKSKAIKSKLGWLLNKKFRGQRLTQTVPARPIIGVTKKTREAVRHAIQVLIMEVG